MKAYTLTLLTLSFGLSACLQRFHGAKNSSTDPNSLADGILESTARDRFRKLYLEVQRLCTDPKALPLQISTNDSAEMWSTTIWRTLRTQSIENHVVSVEGAQQIPYAPQFWSAFLDHFRRDSELQRMYKDIIRNDAKAKRFPNFDYWVYFNTNDLCSGSAQHAWAQTYEDVFQFVIDTYAATYGFGPDFAQKIRYQSVSNSDRMHYVIVRSKASNELLGLLRLVAAPYGRRYVVKKGAAPSEDSAIIKDESGAFGPSVYDVEKIPVSVMDRTPTGLRYVSAPTWQETYRNWKSAAERVAKMRESLSIKEIGPLPQWESLDGKALDSDWFSELPLERNYRIKLPRNALGSLAKGESDPEGEVYYAAGILVEPGNFVIRRGSSSTVKAMIFRQLIEETVSTFGKWPVMFWVESRFTRLYSPLCFKVRGTRNAEQGRTAYIMSVSKEVLLKRLSALTSGISGVRRPADLQYLLDNLLNRAPESALEPPPKDTPNQMSCS